MSTTLWDFVNSIQHKKNDLLQDDTDHQVEKKYVPFLTNLALSFSTDTILYANEMNQRPFLDHKLQYHYLLNTIRPKKRFNKWIKAEKTEKLQLIATYYNYNIKKAKEVEDLFSDEDINVLRTKLFTGGLKE